jgi:hypothetical protein
MQWSNVVMVVICLARMPAKFIQLASQKGIRPAIVLDGIENRHAIRGYRNRPAKEVVFG